MISDHSPDGGPTSTAAVSPGALEEVSVSKFKATCLALLEKVRETGRPILVTKRGVALAEVVPPSARHLGIRELGSLARSGRITGDIVAPVADPASWEALR
ncbi:MAG: type II toxin-antitoxin system prevent-host-death family antitoxin [Actinomycetota bacterium]|nr:type II toxin-antitoxin system prevent-host-death family antitoxin [Actinomycetota bacterium]